MKTTYWSASLKTTTNQATGNTRYFMMRCGNWERMGKVAYKAVSDQADISNCFSTSIRKGIVHQYKTISGEYVFS